MRNYNIDQQIEILKAGLEGRLGYKADFSGFASQEAINIFKQQLTKNNMKKLKDKLDNEICVGDILEVNLSYSCGDAILIEEENGEVVFRSNLDNKKHNISDLEALNAIVIGNAIQSPELIEQYKF